MWCVSSEEAFKKRPIKSTPGLFGGGAEPSSSALASHMQDSARAQTGREIPP